MFRSTRFGKRFLPAGLAAIVVLVAVSAPASGHKPDGQSLRGLKVLLTNDDSMQASRPNNSDGLGLYEVRRALCAAGADVVAIAPWQVQSGRGTAVSNSGVLHLGQKPLPAGYENDCRGAASGGPVYGLCLVAAPCGASSASATPSDTVKIALRGGLEHTVGWEKPDLIVSGSNSGLNVSSSVNDSGTVGAAVAAVEDDIPAVAFSSHSNAAGIFPVENYRATAEWGARFIAGLRARGLLFQHKFAVSVNYPNIADGAPAKKAVWARVGTAVVALHSYLPQPDGSFLISLGLCTGLPECEETRKDADAPAVRERNHITVTAITWDRTYGTPIDGRRELAKVRNYVQRNAPRP